MRSARLLSCILLQGLYSALCCAVVNRDGQIQFKLLVLNTGNLKLFQNSHLALCGKHKYGLLSLDEGTCTIRPYTRNAPTGSSRDKGWCPGWKTYSPKCARAPDKQQRHHHHRPPVTTSCTAWRSLATHRQIEEDAEEDLYGRREVGLH